MKILQALPVKYKDLTITSLLIVLTFIILFILIQVFKITNNFTLLYLQQFLFLVPLIYFLSKKKISLKDIGFQNFKLLKSLGLVILAFISYYIIMLSILFTLEHYSISLPGFGIQPSYAPIFENLSIYQSLFTAALIVPIIEELFFRGFLYKIIHQKSSYKIILTAIIFAVAHLQFTVLGPLLILGVILAVLRYKSSNLYTAIIFHCCNNALAVLAYYYLPNAIILL